MKEKEIEKIVSTYLHRMVDTKLNRLLGKIESEMQDANQVPEEEWRTWFPIDSKVSNSEIEELETKIGYGLPSDFKTLLKYQHFYELRISEASFCKHPIHYWSAELLKMIYNGYPREYLIDKGYIPFADWSDWGMLCFDTNRNQEDKNYPIVLWDHERWDEVQDQYEDFYDLMIKLDEEDKRSNS